MNLYRCVSEQLTSFGRYDPPEPPEDYRIVELVAAETRGRARWLAWSTDRDSFTGSVVDMPKFSIVCTRRDVSAPEGILVYPFRPIWWSTAREIKARRAMGCARRLAGEEP